jgi:hypothetical protein
MICLRISYKRGQAPDWEGDKFELRDPNKDSVHLNMNSWNVGPYWAILEPGWDPYYIKAPFIERFELWAE